jgi:hypothetical protein
MVSCVQKPQCGHVSTDSKTMGAGVIISNGAAENASALPVSALLRGPDAKTFYPKSRASIGHLTIDYARRHAADAQLLGSGGNIYLPQDTRSYEHASGRPKLPRGICRLN